MLQLRNNREMLDDLLISMLMRCKRLTRLQYDGIIRSLDTLRDICQLQAESKTRKNSNVYFHSTDSLSSSSSLSRIIYFNFVRFKEKIREIDLEGQFVFSFFFFFKIDFRTIHVKPRNVNARNLGDGICDEPVITHRK